MRRISSSHFIWTAAKTQDSNALKKALASELIDIYEINAPETSVITRLAKSVDKKATYFLMAFGAQKIFAVLGAALSGDENWLDELLEYNNQPLLNMAARGAGISGNQLLAHQLEKRGADPEAILLGAAIGKHFAWVDKLLKASKNPDRFDLAAKGAAIAKADEAVTHYLTLGASLKSAICGAGIAGNIDFAKKLLEKGLKKNNLINECAFGLALGGNKVLLQSFCLSYKPDMSAVLFGFAQRGDHLEAKSMLLQYKLDAKYLLIGAAIGKHQEWYERLKKTYANTYELYEKTLSRFNPHKKITLDEVKNNETLEYFFMPRHPVAPTFFTSEHPAITEKPKSPVEAFTFTESDTDSDTFSWGSN
jgi:hypothetical protein